MPKRMYNVLFICTGNSARSIMAEAIMNRLGRDRYRAYSAGSRPCGEVHPLTLEVLSHQCYDVGGLRSKSWMEFAQPDAPQMDFIFTVCDHAAGETCPAWPGQPITAHWSFVDPVKVQGSREEQLKAFTSAEYQIANRVRLFLSLPVERIDRLSLQTRLRELEQKHDLISQE